MPKSKRAKVITLTKTKSKDKTAKSSLIAKAQELIDKYSYFYVFKVANLRTKLFQNARVHFKEHHDSVFFMGKKSLIKMAFGKNADESYMKNLYKLSEFLDSAGQDASEKNSNSSPNTDVGILFSNSKDTKVMQKDLATFEEMEFARGGFDVPDGMSDIFRNAGELEGLPTSMFEHLRKLKLPVVINKGKLELTDNFTLCKAGDSLTVEQAELLKLFGYKLAKFEINLVAKYSKTNGKIQEL